MKDSKNLCPCCSDIEYDQCCKPFHEGRLPEKALQLMRSRYSAYALNLPDYIMATTHPSNQHYSKNKLTWRKNLAEFSKNTSFDKLEIHNYTDSTVTFTAHLTQNGKDATFTEKSLFEKIDQRWLYVSGKLVQGRKPNL